MKILIMCQGASLDSPIARGVDRADYHLLVDPTTLITELCPALPCEHEARLLLHAAEHGVTAVLTGSDDATSKVVLTPAVMMVYFGDGISAREALRRWRSGEIFEGPPAQDAALHSGPAPQVWFRRLAFLPPGIPAPRKGWSSRATPRGRHHIQQYAGRGH